MSVDTVSRGVEGELPVDTVSGQVEGELPVDTVSGGVKGRAHQAEQVTDERLAPASTPLFWSAHFSNKRLSWHHRH